MRPAWTDKRRAKRTDPPPDPWPMQHPASLFSVRATMALAAVVFTLLLFWLIKP